MRHRRHVRRMEPDRQSAVPPWRKAASGTRSSRPSCRRRRTARLSRPDRRPGKMLLSECLADGAARGTPDGKNVDGSDVPRRDVRHNAAVVGEGVHRQSIRRLPERCDCRRFAARGARGLYRMSSSSSATPRPAWRPIRASSATSTQLPSRGGQAQIDRAGRHDDVPAFLYPGRVRHALAGPFDGHHFQPVRKTPLHEWAAELGAVFVETGLWLRSAWFPQRRRGLAGECDP